MPGTQELTPPPRAEPPRISLGHGEVTPSTSEPAGATPKADWVTRMRVIRPIQRLVHGLLAHNAFETAASIAFWFFLSLVPLLVFVGWLLGRVVQSKGADTLLDP